jgi:hypothetical protein
MNRAVAPVNTKHHDNDLGHDNNHDNNDDNEQLEDRGRGLGLRLLALLGAVSFLMLGISSIA